MSIKYLKNISGETGEMCTIDIEMLHDALLSMPAGYYIALYNMMAVQMGAQAHTRAAAKGRKHANT